MKLLIGILIFLPVSSLAFMNPPQYFSLLPPEAYDFQRKGLDAYDICHKLYNSSDSQFHECVKEHTVVKKWSLSAYENPDANSKVLGKIVVTSEQQGRIYAEYIANGMTPVMFPNDSGENSIESMNFFLYTVNDIKGDWIQLPARPFIKPVWINLKKDWPNEKMIGVSKWHEGRMYIMDNLGVFLVVKMNKETLIYRKANYKDGICDEGQGPTEEQKHITDEDMKLHEMRIRDLFDSDEHLLAWPTEGIGC